MEWIRRKKSHRRRAKRPAEKRRREKTQRKRLLLLGVPPEVVEKMNTKQVREALKRPERTRKEWAKKTAGVS